MPHPDEGLIHAWLDGELSPEEAARVERLVNEDPAWAAAAAEARGLVAASSRILRALDVVPADVTPAETSHDRVSHDVHGTVGARGASSRSSRFRVRPWMRAAAALVVVVGTTIVVTDRADVDSAFEPASGDARPTVQVQSQPQPSAVADADRPVVAESSARTEETREAAAAALSAPTANSREQRASQPTADSAPARKSASRSLAVAPAPPPAAPQPDSFEALRAITPPAESPPADNVMRLRSERGFGAVSAAASPVASGMTVSATVLDGCWRTITRAAVDSVLVSPRISQTTGRMLTIVASELAATVVQQADTLRGTIVDADGARVPFRAERIVCR